MCVCEGESDTSERVCVCVSGPGLRGQGTVIIPVQAPRKCRPTAIPVWRAQACSGSLVLPPPHAPAPSSPCGNSPGFKFQTLTNDCRHFPSGTGGDAALTCIPFQITLRIDFLAGSLPWENHGALFRAADSGRMCLYPVSVYITTPQNQTLEQRGPSAPSRPGLP